MPMTATATKFTELLMRKNATERRAICSAGIPPRLRIHAPSARPPAPLAGTIEPTAELRQPISQLVRHDIRRQNTGRNISDVGDARQELEDDADAIQPGRRRGRRPRTSPRPGASAATRHDDAEQRDDLSARRTSRRGGNSSGSATGRSAWLSTGECRSRARSASRPGAAASGPSPGCPRRQAAAGASSGIASRRPTIALGVARVVAEVEDRVEVEPEVALGEQLAQLDARVPRALGVLLDDPVRLVAAAALRDEREQDPLGEQRPVGEVEVRAHAVRVDDEAAHDARREVLHVVEQDRRVGQDHALGARVRDVALVPERDVLDGRLGVAAQHAREAADALAHDRVALVRHRARALLLPGAERLLGLADLGALEVADLGREPLEARAGERDRLQQRGVAVARDDLGRDRLGGEPEAREDARLEVGVGGRVRADGAAQRADRRLGERAPAGAGRCARPRTRSRRA